MSFRIGGPWITDLPVSGFLRFGKRRTTCSWKPEDEIEMVGSYICCGIQPKMITSAGCRDASRMTISRDWAPGLSNAHRKGPNLGNSLAAIDLQLGQKISSRGIVACSNFPPGGFSPGLGLRISSHGIVGFSNFPPGGLSLGLGLRISSHGIVGCSNFPPGGLSRVQGRAMGLGSSCAAIPHSSSSSRRVKANNKLENGREEAITSSQKEEEVEEDKKKSIDKKEGGLVERIEAELGRQFGGVLWFSVLLLSLAFFGGFYVFFIVRYADFSDIPILNGPQR